MKSTHRNLAVYFLTHFAIDFACFTVLHGRFLAGMPDSAAVALGFLTYNLIAFALQMPIGLVIDKTVKSHAIPAMIGCALVVLGVCVSNPYIALPLCALGNAFFHVGGGIDSLANARGRMARSGVFISSGALGVSLGTLAGGNIAPWMVALMVALCGLAIIFVCGDKAHESSFDSSAAAVKTAKYFIILCLFAVIVRSYTGMTTPVPWRGEKALQLLYLLPSICAFAGKFIGGFLADRIGARRIAVAAVLLSMPLICFGNGQIILCCIGLMLFNIPTAVTLCAIASKLPKHSGFAFGLSTVALALGWLPTFFFRLGDGSRIGINVVLCLLAAVCIFFTTSKPRGATQ